MKPKTLRAALNQIQDMLDGQEYSAALDQLTTASFCDTLKVWDSTHICGCGKMARHTMLVRARAIVRTNLTPITVHPKIAAVS